MNDAPFEVNGWEQLVLLPKEVTELTLRVGVMPMADHCQFQLEMRDPATGALQMLLSRPHVDLPSALDEFDRMVSELRMQVAQLTGPF